MLQLKNNTPFSASMAMLANEYGIDTLYVTVKASFDIATKWSLSTEQLPPQAEDVYWGEPSESSIRYPSDLHLGKLSSDIIMVGNACAPRGQQATHLDVALRVGSVAKTVRVFGDRQWQDGRITAPQPFEVMPLQYERAYGGSYLQEGEIVSSEMRNPLGCGYAGEANVQQMNGTALPNLEDPNHLIQTLKDQPPPAGFSALAPAWRPRVDYAGSYDQHWQQNRAPFLPEDFDKRFFNVAHPDLIYPGYLQGGEPVAISRMHPDGDLQFELPRVRLSGKVVLAGESKPLPMNLETLLLEPNQLQLAMVWKGAICCDKKALKIGDVSISMLR